MRRFRSVSPPKFSSSILVLATLSSLDYITSSDSVKLETTFFESYLTPHQDWLSDPER